MQYISHFYIHGLLAVTKVEHHLSTVTVMCEVTHGTTSDIIAPLYMGKLSIKTVWPVSGLQTQFIVLICLSRETTYHLSSETVKVNHFNLIRIQVLLCLHTV